MKLPDNEIRDIIKLIEEGKPLPDEYRFKLFEDKREVELVWNGKTNEIINVVLPFQIIEQVDEPRAENSSETKGKLSDQLNWFADFDRRGRQIKGWTNKLIWGDNKLILSNLKNGSLREEIEKNGGIKLIYIDPPFDVGADFSMDIEIGDETLTKKPSVLEEIAYRDTWGKGSDSFIAMLYERLSLMHDLLSEDGSIYVHCDWRVNAFIRLVLDEIFGKENFRNQIEWCYTGPGYWKEYFVKKHDHILFYGKSKNIVFNPQFVQYKSGIHVNKEGFVKTYGGGIKESKVGEIEQRGKPKEDWWDDIYTVDRMRSEIIGYPTQKPEALLERIIKASSNESDIVADFFVGSGTTLAVAEKFGRKWIGSDLGKFSIHTTRKRMINVQRELKKEGKDYRAFEILNLGKYQRQYYTDINNNLTDPQIQQQIVQKERQFVDLIIKAYKAEKISGFKTFVAKKNARLVAIGPIDMPVNRLFVEEIIKEALEKQITQIDIIAFEFEMGLFPHVQEEAKTKGIDLALKYIPSDVFDKRAIEKNQVVFYDVAYIEIKPHFRKNEIAIELTDFSVFYNQDAELSQEAELKDGSSKVVVRDGEVLKLSKDKNGISHQEVLTKKWTDWIDYWAVDFNFENKKEIIRIPRQDMEQPQPDGTFDDKQLLFPDYVEAWTGDYIFENEWQSFRTKKNRNLELASIFQECPKGPRKIAIKVVDIFGNDTMKVIEINI